MSECEMKSSLLQRHSNYIILLAETESPAQRQALLTTITKEQFKVLTLVLYNILQRKVPVQERDIEKLKRYRRILETLTDRDTNSRARLSILKANPLPVVRLLKSSLNGLKIIL